MPISRLPTLSICALSMATLLAAAPALAESAGGASEAWQFEVTPYLFGSALKGTLGARGVTADVDVSFSDLVKFIDFGFAGLFEARKGRWTFALDAGYSKLSADENRSFQGPLGNVNNASLSVDFTQQIYTPYVGYRVLDERTKVDLIGGVRYTSLETDLTLGVTTGGALLPDGSRSVSDSVSWWDPIVGVQVSTPIADNWSLIGYADVGVGGESDSTYQLQALLKWQLGKTYSAKLGYRYLVQDYKKDGIVWDLKFSGPYIGMGIAF